MKRLLPVIILLIAVGAAMWYGHRPAKNPDPNHTHADFAVWLDGKQLDFSGSDFMTEELTDAQLAALETQTATGSKIQVLKQYLHLHDGNGHVIHRHKPGLTLGDFFSTLPWSGSGYVGNVYHLADSPVGDQAFNVRLFVNGVENAQGSAYVFNDGDHLLITNATDPVEVKKELGLMTDDACMYSKTCPWRGPAPTESCISDPTVPCVEVH